MKKQFSLPWHGNAKKHPHAPPHFRQDPVTVAVIDEKLQKGWSTEKVSSSNLLLKRNFILEISTLTKFPQDAVIVFIQLIPDFGIFVRTDNWNQSLPSNNCKYKIILLRYYKVEFFWPKTPKFGDLGSKFWKASVKFNINTFEIGYLQNFVKIKKSILFTPILLGILAQNFRKRISNLKSAPSK